MKNEYSLFRFLDLEKLTDFMKESVVYLLRKSLESRLYINMYF